MQTVNFSIEFLKRMIKKYRLPLKWFLSYFTIMLVVCIGIFVVYNQIQVLFEDKIMKANDLLLEQTKNTIDSKIYDIQKLSTQISLNKEANNFASLKHEIPEDQKINLNILREYLLQSKYINGFIDDVYIYYKNLSIGVSTNGVASKEEIYRLFHRSDIISYSDWESFLEGVYKGKLLKLGNKESNNEFNDILYVQSLPIESSDNPSAILVVNVKQQKFLDIIKTVPLDEKSTVYIADSSNVLISDINYVELLNFGTYSKDDEVLYETINGNQSVVQYKKSKTTNLKYISIMPVTAYWKEKHMMRNTIIISVLIMLIAGIILSLYFTKRNYNPIKRIVLTLKKGFEPGFEHTNSEYEYIQKVIDATIKEKASVEVELFKYSNTLRDNFLLKLLNGKVNNEQYINDAFKSFGINFKKHSFAVILFYIEDYADLFIDDEQNTPIEEQLKLVKFSLVNVFNEIFASNHEGVFVDVGENMQIFLLNCNKEEREELNSQILSATLSANEFLKDNLGISFVASISSINDSVFGVPHSYREALDAMEYRNTSNDKKVIFYHELKRYENCYYYPSEIEYKLFNLIKNGIYESGAEIIDEIFAKNFMDENLSLEWAKCLKFDILSTIVRAADTEKDVSFISELNPIERISNCEYPSQIESELKKILKEICEYVQLYKMQDSNYKLCASISDFINEHYNNTNLGVFMIGDVFNKTPHYLSKLFKNQTGEGLNEYINKVRLEKAKELLGDKNLTIEKIAIDVGFSDSNALIRNFKKYEGVTPGMYKKSLT